MVTYFIYIVSAVALALLWIFFGATEIQTIIYVLAFLISAILMEVCQINNKLNKK